MSARDPSSDATPRLRPWHAVLALVVVGVGAQVVGLVVAALAFVIDLVASGKALDDVGTTPSITFAVIGPSLVATGLALGGGAALTAVAARVPVAHALGIRGAPWPAFVAAPLGILALGPLSDVLRRAMQIYAPALTFGSLDHLEEVVHSAPVWVVAPLFALVPGISEELLFRGMFQRAIRSPWLAVVLSGLLFSAYHTDPHHVVAVLPLGLYLAWLGQRTGSVLVPITAHVANNGAAVIVSVFFADERERAPELAGDDLLGVAAGLLIAALAMAVVAWSTRARAAAPNREPDVQPLAAPSDD